jgi:DNA-binding transcriptional LysR family regulator
MARSRAAAAPALSELDPVVVFAVVARERSFTRAADVLGISQPSISGRIRRLETLLGEPLFERLGRGVRLTPTGESLREVAERALAVAQDAGELVAGLSGQSRGLVRCAASTTIAGYVLPRGLARLRVARPQVDVEIRVGNTAEVAGAIERGDVPWGLVEGPVDPTRFETRRFMDDELILVVPAGHPWSRRRRIAPQALLAEPFIDREPGSGTGAIAERALAAQGIRIRPYLRIAHSRGLVAAVAAGAGVAIVSALVAAPFVQSKEVVPVVLSGIDLRRPFLFVQLPGRSLTRLDLVMLDAVGARMRPP